MVSSSNATPAAKTASRPSQSPPPAAAGPSSSSSAASAPLVAATTASEPPLQPAPLEPDTDPSSSSDTDSALDAGSDTSSYTTSVMTEVRAYKYENGRRYHAYREGQYVLPNDETEQDRQDLLHHVRNLALGGRLFRAPVGKGGKGVEVGRVLDVGTGTGIWAIDFADMFPEAQVVGTDLSPIQPSWVPPNLHFLVDDAESQWLWSHNNPFDFIHMRDLGGAIADWPRLIRQALEHLRPGGWLELQEFDVTLHSDDDTMRLAPLLREYIQHLHKAARIFNKPMDAAPGHKQRLVEAGYEDVHEDIIKVPASPWPKDPKQKEIGRYNLAGLLMAVDSYALALFTRVLGWSKDETLVFLAGVKKELQNPKVHAYGNLHLVYGRKPL